MPDTLAFHSVSEVSGAGPVLKRVNEESPMNWGHSYCNKFELTALVVTASCAFTCIVKTAANDEMTSSVKINVTLSLVCMEPLPPRMNGRVLFHYKLYGKPRKQPSGNIFNHKVLPRLLSLN